MIDTVLIERTPRQTRTALIAAGRVDQILLRRPAGTAPRVGDIYAGRVVGLARNLGGGFVDLGSEAIGFVRDTALREGEALVVQVAAATGDKGARLSRQITLTGRGVVIEPWGIGRGVSRRLGAADQRRLGALARRIEGSFGLTLRSAAGAMADDTIMAEAAALGTEAEALRVDARRGPVPRLIAPAPPDVERALADHPGVRRVIGATADLVAASRGLLAGRPWAAEIAWETADTGPALFETTGVEAAFERALQPRVAVAGGVELGFATGAALTAIDVDSAGAGDRGALACNLAAARAIPDELRLRGIGGLIVVDFIGLDAERDKRAVMAALAAAAAEDRQITACHGLSPLGLAEIARRRSGPSLAEATTEPCPRCDGGRHPAPAAVADAIARRLLREAARRPGAFTVRCGAAVAGALADPRLGGIGALEGLLGGALTVAAVATDHPDGFDVARTAAP